MIKAKIFADTRKMTRDEWLEARRNGIGGSDASAILGLNPYSSPLRIYLDKIGKGDEPETNEAMRQGTDLEEYVAKRFTEETGKKVKKCNKILQSFDRPFMLANVDRLIVGEDAGLECKTTSPFSKFKFEEGEINPHYYWQSVHYMAVTGAKKWYVAVLVLGKAFHVFEVARNEDEINKLVVAEFDFWHQHVMKKVPPLPTGNDVDDEAVAALYPAGDVERDDILDMTGLEDSLNLRDFKARQRDQLDAEIKAIDQDLKLSLGTFQRGLCGDWKVNWTNTSTSRIDTAALKKKYPQIAQEVTKTTTGRRFSVAKIKEV